MEDFYTIDIANRKQTHHSCPVLYTVLFAAVLWVCVLILHYAKRYRTYGILVTMTSILLIEDRAL